MLTYPDYRYDAKLRKHFIRFAIGSLPIKLYASPVSATNAIGSPHVIIGPDEIYGLPTDNPHEWEREFAAYVKQHCCVDLPTRYSLCHMWQQPDYFILSEAPHA